MRALIKFIKENGIVETAFEVGFALFIIALFVSFAFDVLKPIFD